jgi:hypothetical protein
MGSIGDNAKGQQPMLDRIKRHNEEYNSRAEEIARRAPRWRRWLALLPDPKKPLHDWLNRQRKF